MDGHLLAGMGAGVATSLLLHPLDLIKVRLQVQDGRVHAVRYGSLWQAIRTIGLEEGVRGFYRGVTPGALGSGLSWGLYFGFYEAAKARLARQEGGGRPTLTTAQHLYAAWEAGTAACLLTNPVWLVKTRMQLQTGATVRPYRNVGHALSSIVSEEGVAGLYRGLTPALLLVSHGMIQFTVYEEGKILLSSWAMARDSPTARASAMFALGAGSKAVATIATYPYQVIKARLQQRVQADGMRYAGLADVVRRTWALEGWRGFYKGFAANLLRVAPQSAITLTVYEALRSWFQQYNGTEITRGPPPGSAPSTHANTPPTDSEEQTLWRQVEAAVALEEADG